jgi:hypothetical protein
MIRRAIARDRAWQKRLKCGREETEAACQTIRP